MAGRRRRSLRRRLGAWGEHHLRALVGALGRFRASLAPSIMTAAVIGIALALPAGFLVVLDNVQTVTHGWAGSPRASLFLSMDTNAQQQRDLAGEIRSRPDVASVEVVTRAEALKEFRRYSGFDKALDMLDDNPLPPVLVVEPAEGLRPGAIDQLVAALGARPTVERVRLDRGWVRRLHAIMQLAERGIWVITGLLGITVVLVVGNTIRLDIENRRDEIVITKLIGATDAFVRRPFLYSGLWYGLAGGLLSVVLVELGLILLDGPAGRLAALYNSSFALAGVGLSGALTLLGCGAFLGLLGSWLAVARHLTAIEPR